MKYFRHPLVLLGILIVVVLLAAGVWGRLSGFWESPQHPAETAAPESAASASGLVQLTPGKRKQAGIQTAKVERRSLREWRTIPGRFQYNQTRHIALQAPTDGTLQEIKVKPGDTVQPGTLVAVFLSATIGKARAEVLQLEAQLAIATRRWDWEHQVVLHTQELVDILARDPGDAEVEKTFKTRTLGQTRETLLSAYSKLHLANQLMAGSESLRNAGAMSAKTLQERTASQQTAEAAYRAATEQVLFDSGQRSAQAKAEFENAQKQLEVGKQKLNALLGYADTPPAEDSKIPLSQVELRSPIAGTVEEIRFAPNERVAEKDPLFVVADTSNLWVAAEIRDSDWAALNIAVGDWIEVQTPALPDKSLQAQVIYVGREVSDITHSLPLVAEIDNAQGQFRPGLFARVNVPVGQAIKVLAVRPESLMRHEGKTFVFIKQKDGQFLRVDVVTGMETPKWTEIRHGLQGGEEVVEHGAFLLKSELLLEKEEE